MGFIWTQSATKDLEKEETCPSRWKGQWLDKLFKSKTSEAADYGNYFEYLCIGANAKGEAIKDLPRLANGGKSATQRRIELQADKFKDLTDTLSKSFLGYDLMDAQVHVHGEVSGVKTEGTIDMMMQRDASHVVADLKLTEDLDNVRTKYGWGNPTTEMDLLQQVLYGYLYEQMTGIKPELVLFVFEHGPKMRVKIIKLKVSESKVEEMIKRIGTAAEVIDLYNTRGWSYDPSEKECGACGLTDCLKRFKPQQLIIENIIY